jgi:hypothetical protein
MAGMANRQLNLRLDESTWETLDLLAFLEEKAIIDLVRPEIEALARRGGEPGLQSARRARKEHQAFRDASDASLPTAKAEHEVT